MGYENFLMNNRMNKARSDGSGSMSLGPEMWKTVTFSLKIL